MTSNTDSETEQKILEWIEDMLDEQLSKNFGEALKDGVVLCRIVNKIQPGLIPTINTNPGILAHLENISAYLQACWSLGVPSDAMFVTQDLCQQRNLPAVVKNISALASTLYSTPKSSPRDPPVESPAPTTTLSEAHNILPDPYSNVLRQSGSIYDVSNPASASNTITRYDSLNSSSISITVTESEEFHTPYSTITNSGMITNSGTFTKNDSGTVTPSGTVTRDSGTVTRDSGTVTLQQVQADLEEARIENEELMEENEALRKRLKRCQFELDEMESAMGEKDTEIAELKAKIEALSVARPQTPPPPSPILTLKPTPAVTPSEAAVPIDPTPTDTTVEPAKLPDLTVTSDANSNTNTSNTNATITPSSTLQREPSVDGTELSRVNKKYEKLYHKYEKLKSKFKASLEEESTTSHSRSRSHRHRSHRNRDRDGGGGDGETPNQTPSQTPNQTPRSKSERERDGEERKLRLTESTRRISTETSRRISSEHRKSITTKDIDEGKFKLEDISAQNSPKAEKTPRRERSSEREKSDRSERAERVERDRSQSLSAEGKPTPEPLGMHKSVSVKTVPSPSTQAKHARSKSSDVAQAAKEAAKRLSDTPTSHHTHSNSATSTPTHSSQLLTPNSTPTPKKESSSGSVGKEEKEGKEKDKPSPFKKANWTLRGIFSKDHKSPSKDAKVYSASEIKNTLENILKGNHQGKLGYEDVLKFNFKTDTSRRMFSLILEGQMRNVPDMHLSDNSFEMLLFLMNASVQEMDAVDVTDTMALRVLLKASGFYREVNGVKETILQHIKDHEVWKRFEFWEEYFYSDLSKEKEPEAILKLLKSVVTQMVDFGVAGGPIHKLVSDVKSKEIVNLEALTELEREVVPQLGKQSARQASLPPNTPVPGSQAVVASQRHTFNKKTTRKPAFCDHCKEFIWGVSRVVYICDDCKFTIHKKCIDECLPNSACDGKRADGVVFGVTHNVHVTKGAKSGYEGLPQEWKNLLTDAGIEKSDILANPHAVLNIMEYEQRRALRSPTHLTPVLSQRNLLRSNPTTPLTRTRTHSPRHPLGSGAGTPMAGGVPGAAGAGLHRNSAMLSPAVTSLGHGQSPMGNSPALMSPAAAAASPVAGGMMSSLAALAVTSSLHTLANIPATGDVRSPALPPPPMPPVGEEGGEPITAKSPFSVSSGVDSMPTSAAGMAAPSPSVVTVASPLPAPLPPTDEERDDMSVSGEGEEGEEAPEMDDEEEPEAPINLDEILSKGDPKMLYTNITHIGAGANAEVFAALSVQSNIQVAIKKIPYDPLKCKELMNEIQIMKSVSHDSIVNCTDCFLVNNDTELWVVMEYIDFGSLTDVLEMFDSGVQLTEQQIAYISKKVLLGLELLHTNSIIHRDVKSDNILLSNNGRVALGDFGSAARLSSRRPNRKTVIGSPYWMAPELIKGEAYDQKVDVFSFGCMLREMAEGEPPFAEYPPLKTLYMLATADVPALRDTEKWSANFVGFCNLCVVRDAELRPTPSELLKHPFMTETEIPTDKDFVTILEATRAAKEKLFMF